MTALPCFWPQGADLTILPSHFSRRRTSVFVNDSAVMRLKRSVRANQKHENLQRVTRCGWIVLTGSCHHVLFFYLFRFIFCFFFSVSSVRVKVRRSGRRRETMSAGLRSWLTAGCRGCTASRRPDGRNAHSGWDLTDERLCVFRSDSVCVCVGVHTNAGLCVQVCLNPAIQNSFRRSRRDSCCLASSGQRAFFFMVLSGFHFNICQQTEGLKTNCWLCITPTLSNGSAAHHP